MLTILIFIIILGVLVLVHEFGHFIVAKRSGMGVEEFGFGFPPRLWGVKKGETMYSVNWIPFGGFVKITGEDGEHRDNPRSFTSKSGKIRALVLTAGVIMNLILALVLFPLGNVVGALGFSRVELATEQELNSAQEVKIQIARVFPGSPAEEAGIKLSDEIAGFIENGDLFEVTAIEQVQGFINSHKGQQVTILLKNDDTEFTKIVTPRLVNPEGEGSLGISLMTTGVLKGSVAEAITNGVRDTGYVFYYTVLGYGSIIKSLFTNGNAGADLAGPVQLAVTTGEVARFGISYLIRFTAIISVNLAILNIIPFPALDGGRLLFLIIEKIKRSPISKRVEMTANTIGFALLLLLMVYVTSKDVIKLF